MNDYGDKGRVFRARKDALQNKVHFWQRVWAINGDPPLRIQSSPIRRVGKTMKFDPKIHYRHSIRLQGYDYSQAGAYYITIVTFGRECLFGQVTDGCMQLNHFGQIVQRAWFDLPNHYPHVDLGAFCIMPNHAHGIIVLDDIRRGGSFGEALLSETIISCNVSLHDDAQTRPYSMIKRHPLSEIVRAFKSFSAKRINTLRKTPGTSVWQRNYYEHIIRNEDDYQRIQYYIEFNPVNWMEDDENPKLKP